MYKFFNFIIENGVVSVFLKWEKSQSSSESILFFIFFVLEKYLFWWNVITQSQCTLQQKNLSNSVHLEEGLNLIKWIWSSIWWFLDSWDTQVNRFYNWAHYTNSTSTNNKMMLFRFNEMMWSWYLVRLCYSVQIKNSFPTAECENCHQCCIL